MKSFCLSGVLVVSFFAVGCGTFWVDRVAAYDERIENLEASVVTTEADSILLEGELVRLRSERDAAIDVAVVEASNKHVILAAILNLGGLALQGAIKVARKGVIG